MSRTEIIIYKCDACKNEMPQDEYVEVKISPSWTTLMTSWDLCKSCNDKFVARLSGKVRWN